MPSVFDPLSSETCSIAVSSQLTLGCTFPLPFPAVPPAFLGLGRPSLKLNLFFELPDALGNLLNGDSFPASVLAYPPKGLFETLKSKLYFGGRLGVEGWPKMTERGTSGLEKGELVLVLVMTVLALEVLVMFRRVDGRRGVDDEPERERGRLVRALGVFCVEEAGRVVGFGS